MKENLETTTNLEVDKLELSIPLECCKLPKDIEKTSDIGLNLWFKENSLHLSVSGKMFFTPNSLGEITKFNYKEICPRIERLTGIEIDQDFLISSSSVYHLHVKKDIMTEDAPEYYISELRELFKRNTDKYDVYKYKDLTYPKGLAVIPKNCGLVLNPKTRDNDRFLIYKKGAELRKPENKEYRENLDYRFIQETDKILRFEYQMRKFEDMRKALNLPDGCTPTINNIFNSNSDPVSDFFNKLLNEQKKGE